MRTILVLTLMMLSNLVFAEGSVARATFCTGVEDREPVGELTGTAAMRGDVYFFTELSDLAGNTVIHRWSHGGQIHAEISFEVGGNRWRTWSSKALDDTMSGDWTVAVVTASGELLAEHSLTITP